MSGCLIERLECVSHSPFGFGSRQLGIHCALLECGYDCTHLRPGVTTNALNKVFVRLRAESNIESQSSKDVRLRVSYQ